MKRLLPALLATLALAARAAEPPLTVDAAAELAARHSKVAQLVRLKAAEADLDLAAARQLRYPRLTAFGIGGYYFQPLDLKLRQGSLTPTLDTLGVQLGLGPLSPQIGPFPSTDLTLVRGDYTQVFGGLTLLQPLTQQWRIASGIQAARAARTGADRETARMLSQIRRSIERLFAGIALEDQRQQQQRARVAFAESRLRDAENAQTVGEALDAPVLGARAAVVQARAERLRSEQHRAELVLQLAELIGRPADSGLVLAPELPARAPHPLDYWTTRARQNPDRQIALATADRARAGVRAARHARIPELSAYATGFAQDGLPLVPTSGGTVGLALTWDIFDGGRRHAEVARSLNHQRAAELDAERLGEEADRLVRTAYQDFAYAEQQVELATEAATYRRRAAELARQSAGQGLTLATGALEAEADWRQAEADLTAARLQRHLALLELYFLCGDLL